MRQRHKKKPLGRVRGGKEEEKERERETHREREGDTDRERDRSEQQCRQQLFVAQWV